MSCWGDNGAGQAGQPFTSIIERLGAPAQVTSLVDVVEIAAGESFTCVRKRDATVSCFGRMTLPPTRECPHGPGEACVESFKPGELEAATAEAYRAHTIEGVHDAVQLAAGDGFACALTKPGDVWCWGSNTLGQLGTGDVAPHIGAVRANISDAIAISASSAWDACALTRSGEVWCWGVLFSLVPGVHGPGPVRIERLGKAKAIGVGGDFACATLADASVWCWGSGTSGQTGHGAIEAAHEPRPVGL